MQGSCNVIVQVIRRRLCLLMETWNLQFLELATRFCFGLGFDADQLMVWGPVVWNFWGPLMKGICYLAVPLESQTTGPQLAEQMKVCEINAPFILRYP